MNIALCTMLDDNFMIGYECFIKSFLKYNKWFNYDFVIIDNGISDENRRLIKSHYEKIIFKSPRKKHYAEVDFSKTHKKLQATFYKLDVFSYYEYDRIVFMDMDIVVLGNIKKIFDCKDDIAACRAYNAKMDTLGQTINSGVFVLNNNVITKGNYTALIRMAIDRSNKRRGLSMPDQKIINIHFADRMQYLDKRFNVEKRMQHTRQYKGIYENALCLHYVASKPWEKEKFNEIEKSFGKSEKLWWDEYNG